MKNLRLKSVLVVLLVTIGLVSCDNDETVPVTEITKNAFVIDLQGPETGKVNESINYDVIFVPETTCGVFSKFTEATIGTEKGLQVEVKYPSEICTKEAPKPVKEVYTFKSATAGTFEIKFKKSETEFITKTVVITE